MRARAAFLLLQICLLLGAFTAPPASAQGLGFTVPPTPGDNRFYPWSQVQNKCRNTTTDEGRAVCAPIIAQDRRNDWNDSSLVQGRIADIWDQHPEFYDRAFTELAIEEPRYKEGWAAGEWKMVNVLNRLENEFSLYPEENLKRIQAWQKASPDKPMPYIMEAAYWTALALKARGSGTASTVSPEGWQLFRERLERGDAVLEKSRAISQSLPHWYAMKLRFGYYLDKRAEMEPVYQEAVRKWPTYYSLYNIKLFFLMPRWGGSLEAVDRYIAQASKAAGGAEGKVLYARLYAMAGEDDRVSLFKETRASWPEMKAGFEEWLKRYPQSSYLQKLGAYACLARDRETTLQVIETLRKSGGKPDWWRPYSADSCVNWAERS